MPATPTMKELIRIETRLIDVHFHVVMSLEITFDIIIIIIIIIIIYHDFLPTPRRGSHVKSGKTHTHSHHDTPLIPYT